MVGYVSLDGHEDDASSSYVGTQEAARAYSNMNPVEKAVFSLTRAILGNKKARTAFILYACALHLLVMYTTWECALSGSSQDQFQKQRNPFVRPSLTLTRLDSLKPFYPVTTRFLLLFLVLLIIHCMS